MIRDKEQRLIAIEKRNQEIKESRDYAQKFNSLLERKALIKVETPEIKYV